MSKYLRKPIKLKARRYHRTFAFTTDRGAKGNFLKAGELVGCDCFDGKLQSLYDWTALNAPSGSQYKCNVAGILEAGTLKVQDDSLGDLYQDICYLITKSGAFYIYVKEKKMFYCAATNLGKATVQPLITKGGTKIAVFSERGLLFVGVDGQYEEILTEDVMPAGVFFRHRLFVGMKRGVLKYSAPEEVDNFTPSVDGGGEIRFPNMGGDILAIKAHDDGLYVFFQCGIMHLHVGGEPSSFYAEKLDYMGGTIYPRTICACSKALYFLTSEGMYRLKNKQLQRLDLDRNFSGTLDGLEGCAVWEDRPVIRYMDGDGTYKTFILDKDERKTIAINAVEALGQEEGGTAVIMDESRWLWRLTRNGELHFTGVFVSHPCDLGTAGKKTLRKLSFAGEGVAYLLVSTGGKMIYRTLTFENGYAETEVITQGESFVFTISVEHGTKILSMHADFEIAV